MSNQGKTGALSGIAIVAALGFQPVLGQDSGVGDVNDKERATPRIVISVSRAANVDPASGRMIDVEYTGPDAPASEAGKQASEQETLPAIDMAGVLPRAVPLSGSWITSRFGRRLNPVTGLWALHRGVDLAAPYGTPVFATSKGRVAQSGRAGGYGIVVVLNHGAGIETRYAHLSTAAVGLGTSVREGQIIGFVGSTGRSTGPHLHYEIRQGSKALDPEQIWRR